MKQLKKYLALGLGIVMASSALVGCGSNSKELSGTNSNQTSTSKQDEKAKDVTIRLYIPFSSQEPANKPTQEIVNQFMEDNPNIKVELEVQTATQYHDKLKTEIASDTLANVFVSWGGSELVEAVKSGKVMDLTEMLEADPEFKDGFLSSALTATNVTYEDIPGLWGMPLSNVAAGFYYNKDLFEKAGVEPPTTWEEMYTVIEKLKAIDTIPISLGGKDGWRVEHLYSQIFYSWNGVGKSKDLANRTMKYTDEGATKPWEVLLKIKDMGGFGPDPASVDFGMEQNLFKTGKAAMNFSLSAFVETFSGADSEIKDVVGFFAAPTFADKPEFTGSIFAGGDCALNVAANQSPEELEASYKLVKALTGKEGQSIYLNSNALLMTRKDLELDPNKVNPLMIEFSTYLEVAKECETDVTNPDPVSAMLNKIRSVATAVINGQLTPEQAGKELDDEIRKNEE
ncbi:hypothetical protein CS063_12585 [Sporanaerobium hydrogeniformans]|uniref:Uncharacterized protein n=1 Tax=Sporanaerobium hydrogeniformans TaxID=3072179 RepID=A0AC61DA84_9FIRM|nr:extracellular solute-binding protein [Sporanaerobium hydrogeniformans]PHV69978.1 hypothetical protein CS063_12585 [Sporanaerobium hydrogeniformans]